MKYLCNCPRGEWAPYRDVTQARESLVWGERSLGTSTASAQFNANLQEVMIMSFDSLTIAGILSAILSSGFLFALMHADREERFPRQSCED